MEYTGTSDIILHVESLDGEVKEYKLPHDLKHGDKISLWAGKMISDKEQPYIDTHISRSWTVDLWTLFGKELIDKD